MWVLEALLGWITDSVMKWLDHKERDGALQQEVQDDNRIADQAAAIRVHRDADVVRAEPTVDPVTSFKRERLGRRKSTGDKPLP